MGLKKLEIKDKNKKIGTFDRSQFEVEDVKHVNKIIVEEGIDYDTFIKDIEAEKENNKKEKDLKELNMFKDKSTKVRVRKPVHLDGVELSKPKMNITNKFIGYIQEDMIDTEEIPNEAPLAHVTHIEKTGQDLKCFTDSDDIYFLRLLGFTSKFEAIFSISPNNRIVTGGSGRVYTDSKNYWLTVNVYVFEMNCPVVIKFNNSKFEFRFKELNKKNTTIKGKDFFEIEIKTIKEL